MNVRELHRRLDQIMKISPKSADDEVLIVRRVKGSIGGTPTTPIKDAGAGFDWNNNKFLLFPEHDLDKVKE